MIESFVSRGRRVLEAAWVQALAVDGAHAYRLDLAAACDRVFVGGEAGYHKAIVIQAAGKAADPQLDAHAMQKGEGRERSWDAREFAKQVFVPWNQAAGRPFSHAADPYVSNPYRVPRFDPTIRAQRQRPKEFDAALAVLDLVNATTDPEIAFRNLVEVVYALRRFIADRSIEYPLPHRASLEDVLGCVTAFVSARSGGARLQAIVFALFSALKTQGMSYTDIRSRHINAADASSGEAGDVSFHFDGKRSAVEVKDRPLSKAELVATIDKCRVAQVREALFVIRAGELFAPDFTPEAFADERDRQFSSGLNLYVERFEQFGRTVLALIGEEGRRAFLEAVGGALTQQNADITHKWAWAAHVRSL